MSHVETAELIIRLAAAAVMVIFGIHQVLKPKEWHDEYIPPWLSKMLIVPMFVMQSHGAVNIGLGLIFAITGNRPWVTGLVILWWLSILPFAFRARWQIGLRDAAIIASLVALLVLQTA